jgi:hypothetical protein
MTVEDYTETYYRETLGQTAPATYSGKFVHIVGPSDEYLILSPKEVTKFHAHIVERFCQIHPEMSCSPSQSGDASLFDQSGWEVHGGGRFRIDRSEKTLTLWDSSKAYGIFDGVHIRDALRENPDWGQFDVQLGE